MKINDVEIDPKAIADVAYILPDCRIEVGKERKKVYRYQWRGYFNSELYSEYYSFNKKILVIYMKTNDEDMIFIDEEESKLAEIFNQLVN